MVREVIQVLLFLQQLRFSLAAHRDVVRGKRHYVPLVELQTMPADFECIPGQEAASPFLAMSNYAQAAEPYYEQAHWYGVARIRGQLEHVLIFPRNASSGPSAVIIMESVNSPLTVQLDSNGVIHSD